MRVVHIVAGIGRSQGGPAYTAPSLVAGLRSDGVDAELWSLLHSDDPPLPGVEARLFHGTGDWLSRKLALSTGLLSALRQEAGSTRQTIFHSHGLWLAPNVHAGETARAFRRPLVVSPRGMLAPAALAFSPARKKLFWILAQRHAYGRAAFWHATSESEAQDIRHFGVTAPIKVIPNGVDIPEPALLVRKEPVILFVGRLHPKKGLPSLLEAWKLVQEDFPDWRLRIVGPSEAGHDDQLRRKAERLGLLRISVEEPLYGADKSLALAQASLFILPTINENFGVAVAEALAAETPAIVTRGAPWSGLQTHQCGWWVEHTVKDIAAALRMGMEVEGPERQAMGKRGRAWMERDFSWRKIARDMHDAYKSISSRQSVQ